MKRILAAWSLLLATSCAIRAEDVPADRAALVKGNTRFALELFQKLRAKSLALLEALSLVGIPASSRIPS